MLDGVAGVRPPELVGDAKKDMLTGVAAPPGRRFIRAGWEHTMPGGAQGPVGKIVDRSRHLVEVADFWQPGDPDMGITPRRSDGRILPRIDSVECVIPLTDISGGDLEEPDQYREVFRRGWYAGRMLTAPRLTPVHHIIGPSEMLWIGGITAADAEKRDEWRAKMWEPESIRRLIETYGHLYTLDWDRMPVEKILMPLTGRGRKARKEHDGNAAVLDVCIKRARADLACISRVVRAVRKGDMEAASIEHLTLADNAKVCEKQMAELVAFVA